MGYVGPVLTPSGPSRPAAFGQANNTDETSAALLRPDRRSARRADPRAVLCGHWNRESDVITTAGRTTSAGARTNQVRPSLTSVSSWPSTSLRTHNCRNRHSGAVPQPAFRRRSVWVATRRDSTPRA